MLDKRTANEKIWVLYVPCTLRKTEKQRERTLQRMEMGYLHTHKKLNTKGINVILE